jgi:hypothetical protein
MKLTSRLVQAAALALSSLCVFFAACGYAKRKDPPIYTYDSLALAAESARLHAKDINGMVWPPNECCGSMKPLIQEGDILVSLKTDYEKMSGKVGIYGPKWNNGKPVAHRFVAKDKDGYIASGDANKKSESQERITEHNYIGEVMAIYRVKP